MKQKNIVGLDLLKAVSATLIVFHHYQQDFHCVFTPINFYGGRYYFGNLVELFFVISGFVTLYNEKNGSLFKEFIYKLKRIYPIPFIACVFTLFVESSTICLNGDTEQLSIFWNAKTIIVNLLLLFSGWKPFAMMGINNPTWYLCVLIQCLLLYYFFLYISKKAKVTQVVFFLGAIIISPLLKKWGLIVSDTYRGLESFFLGTCICEILKKIFSEDKTEKNEWGKIFFVGSVFGCGISLLFLYRFPLLQRFILLFGLFPCLVVIAYYLRSYHNSIISLLGRISFEVFVWHYPLIALEKLVIKLFSLKSFSRSYWTMLLFTLSTWLISTLIYRFIEQPGQRKRIKGQSGV